jgi:hypothetical protein
MLYPQAMQALAFVGRATGTNPAAPAFEPRMVYEVNSEQGLANADREAGLRAMRIASCLPQSVTRLGVPLYG